MIQEIRSSRQIIIFFYSGGNLDLVNLDLGIMNIFPTAEMVQHIHILSILDIMKALYSGHILPVPWAVISRLH